MYELLERYRNNRTLRELFRYGVVGLLNNGIGFCVYLLLTWLGTDPSLTMTCLYAVGATAGFFGAKKIAFNHSGRFWQTAIRYGLAHLGGYSINLAMLLYLHERLGWPHQWVQAVAIVVVAGYLFIVLKFFVFSSPRDASTSR
ncbi:hypothetical protein AUC61_12725 [Pseudomonas sp. S25]|uniref:GtrA/DPMS transmembrane domain-containing protein n=1 Tax=Pseudomonas maioricensis TaxID=1766623 RepID=A0ABS9ZIM8_9PSED|nr:GtrA family protein [Pseudomonas sp. S25]MCI8210403.1 hypothetical protein [Pseudomonas sp. S25]